MPRLFSRLFFSIMLLLSCTYLEGCGQIVTDTALTTNKPSNEAFDTQSRSITAQTIALLVPLEGPFAKVGQAVAQGFLAAAQATQNKPRIIVLDTTKYDTIHAAYNQALAQKTQLVVGPLLKPQVYTLATLPLSTPVLALNYLNSETTSPPSLYQFGLSPLDEVRQATQQAWKNGLRSALIISMHDNWSTQIARNFSDAWKSLGGTVVARSTLSTQTSALTQQIKNFLQFTPPHSRRMDFDVIFLVSNPQIGRQVIPLLKFYYAGDIPVYSTAAIYSGLPNRHLDNDLNSVIFCSAPWTLGLSTPYNALYEQLRLSTHSSIFFKLHRSYYALGIDAFHSIQQLGYLKQSAVQTLPGATGLLRLNNQRCIVRQLMCAQFYKGHIRLIST